MKILIPTLKDKNPFFDEITHCSIHDYYYDENAVDISDYDLVLIHWPEQLFNWKEPTINQLLDLKQKLAYWKQKIKIVYMVHNLQPHEGGSVMFTKLYNLIISNCDAMIHLGEFSKKKFEKIYPKRRHIVISHSLYKCSYKIEDKFEARKRLGFRKDSFIVIAPGRVRNLEERKLIIKSFKKLKVKHKQLIVPRMLWKKSDIEFKGRWRLRKIIDVKDLIERLYNFNWNRRCYFNYGFLEHSKLSELVSAADVVFIPRFNSLNSGVLFLGLTFGKVIVGPRTGNLTEILDKYECYSFNPNNLNAVIEALNSAAKDCVFSTKKLDSLLLDELEPINLAKKMDNFFMSLGLN
ncbi:hypothetical protein [Formosa sp. S-31]|uniref:hypothetical protein n=1 Tax=Formosa sp. S-31 TaxID=2790949 RepID=UPI003EBDADD0